MKRNIVIPVAMVAATLQGLQSTSATVNQAEIGSGESKYDAMAAASLSTPGAQRLIRSAGPHVAQVLNIDRSLIDAVYIEVASSGNLADSTTNEPFFNCYGNCHSACHGSRGWR